MSEIITIKDNFRSGEKKSHRIFYKSANSNTSYTSDIPIISSITTTNNNLLGTIENLNIGDESNPAEFSLLYSGNERTFISDINLNITGITGYSDDNPLTIPILCNGTLQRDPVKIYNPNESAVTVSIKQINDGAPLLMIKYKFGDNAWDTNAWTTIIGVNPEDGVIKDFEIPGKKSLFIRSLEDEDIVNITIPDNKKTTLTTWCYQYNYLYFSCDKDKNNNNIINNLEISGDIMSLINENTMAEQCFYQLFKGFKALKTVDKDFLSAKTLSTQCYKEMFNGCTSLTDAPDLPATTLTQECYMYMFNGCESLTTAPLLEVTSVANSCCWGMFSGCTSLIQESTLNGETNIKLSATTLASHCYYEMFNGCESLTTAPKLLATTLASNCCCLMFSGCTSLTKAPELQATALTQECYRTMFYNCKKINNITMLATKATFNSDTNDFQTYGWLEGTAATGTIYITSAMNTLRNNCIDNNHYDPLHIPKNWTVTII